MVAWTREITFPLADIEIKLEIVKDVEQFITDPADEDKVPCWAEIWPAAQGMAVWVWNNLSFKNESMIELGCGLGLPGIICGLKGARVTFSDFNNTALELARKNAAANGVEDFDTYAGDWRQFNIERVFDWILCCDVTYHPRLNMYLLDIIDRHLVPGGGLLVSHPGRHASFEFMKNVEELGPWKKFDTRVAITVEDPVMPYQNIYIHYWRREGNKAVD